MQMKMLTVLIIASERVRCTPFPGPKQKLTTKTGISRDGRSSTGSGTCDLDTLPAVLEDENLLLSSSS